jgi:HEAT repeat protein
VFKFLKMAEKKDTRKLKIQTLLNDICLGNKEKALTAIEGLKLHGDESVIEPLIRFNASEDADEVRFEIQTFLADIISKKAVDEFMRVLVKPDMTEHKAAVLNVIWNSKLDFNPHIDTFVKLAVEGDFLVALECLTVIENLSGPFEEEQIIESQLNLTKYKDHPSKAEQKDQLISEIALFIQTIERNLEG